jgi:hypothetical protein
MRGVIAFVLLVACTPKQPPPPPPPNIVGKPGKTPAIDAGVAPVAVVDAGAAPVVEEPPTPAPDPVDASAIAVPDPIPPVKGTVTKIATNSTVTITGIKITFKYSSHKSGGELGMWGFEAVRFGAKKEFELRHEKEHFESEVDVGGAPLVFRHVDYNNFEIVLATAKGKPLDQDGCRAEIEKAAATRKLTIGDRSGTSEENGVVRFSTNGWVAYCGTLTRRIWFAPPPAERRRRR